MDRRNEAVGSSTKLKILLFRIILVSAVTYPSVHSANYFAQLYGFDSSSIWYSLAISILISVISTIMHFVLAPMKITSVRKFQNSIYLDPAESSKNEVKSLDLLRDYSKLEHNCDVLSIMNEELKEALQKEKSQKLKSDLNILATERARSSGAMTPLALDVSPIERESFLEPNSELSSKEIQTFSPLKRKTQSKAKICPWHFSSKYTSSFSIADNSDVFEKATRNIKMSDFSDLSQSQISDLKISSDIPDTTNITSSEQEINREEIITNTSLSFE